jgi:hypothetical protein
MEKRMTELEQFKQVIHGYLIMENDEYIDVQFGIIFANRFLDSKPVWAYIVGSPGAGKTEILQAFDGCDSIYMLSTLTANTLVSGKICGENEADPSLLPKLDGKVLIIKDFTTILTGRREVRAEILGQLREAYDGSLRKGFGTGKDTNYVSKFGLIAAVTNEIDKHLTALALLGERFLIYRCPELSDCEKRARANRASLNLKTKEQEKSFKSAAQRVLAMKPIKPRLSFVFRKMIENIAMFIARARTSVERDRQTKEVEYFPNPEVPTRLMKQLCDLAMGIAMAREKSTVTLDEIKLIYKVAVDCLPVNKIQILRSLLHFYPKWTRPKIIAEYMRLSENCIKLRLDDFYILDLVDRKDVQESSHSSSKYSWRLKEEYANLLCKGIAYEK